MRTMLHDTPEVLQAYEEYKRFTANPVMWEKIRAQERFEIDQHLLQNAAREEGELRKARETARNLKRLGVPIVTIAEATGLSVSEIERLD